MASGRRGRPYSDEFKSDAVALVHSSGRPIAQVAKEFGVDGSTLSYWLAARKPP